MEKNELTTRERILEALKNGMLTARDISKECHISEKEALEHLPHVAKKTGVTGRNGRPARFAVEPSECMECGFVFRKRDRLKTPSRCPVCKSEEITEMKFGIVEEDQKKFERGRQQ